MLVRLTPRQVPKVWGSTCLRPWFPDAGEKIGEVWFESTTKLPLLVKFLFTTEPLSVQVHPEGKTEMWHILAAEPGAKIAAGFRETISEDRLRASALSGEIENLLQWHDARPGDTFFIPAGTVHAIGAGLALCEIQQYSDVTYRLFDYGRPRELQLEEAIRVGRRDPHTARQIPTEQVLVSCAHFTTEKIRVNGKWRSEPPGRAQMLIVLEGQAAVGTQAIRAGEAWLASESEPPFDVSGTATLLRTY